MLDDIQKLSNRSARLFAADCAEHVLHVFEVEFPNDPRPQEAIAEARAFARGGIDVVALEEAWTAADAAANAAYAAAGSAAYYAAGSAAYYAARSAAYAADAAADAAACAAADAAGWATTDVDAEHEWQADCLAQYLRGELK